VACRQSPVVVAAGIFSPVLRAEVAVVPVRVTGRVEGLAVDAVVPLRSDGRRLDDEDDDVEVFVTTGSCDALQRFTATTFQQPHFTSVFATEVIALNDMDKPS